MVLTAQDSEEDSIEKSCVGILWSSCSMGYAVLTIIAALGGDRVAEGWDVVGLG